MAGLKDALKKLVGTVAPTLGTALGGPLGAMAGKFIQDALGVDSEKAALEQLKTNPDAFVKLKQAEMDFEAKMAELDIRVDEISAADRSDARDLAKALGSIWPQFVLTMIAITAFGAVLYVLVLKSQIIPPENKDVVIFLVGQLSTFVGMGFAFFLGSSKGSKDKNIATALK